MEPLKIAHRGDHRVHPENTLEALRAAYDNGCDSVEFDVQLTRDSVPVIFHDDDFKRLCNVEGNIWEFNLKELPEIVHKDSRYRIPMLKEFMDQCGSRPFYLELKVPEYFDGNEEYWTRLAIKVLNILENYSIHSKSFLASFHIPLLKWLRTETNHPLTAIFEDPRKLQSYLEKPLFGAGISVPWRETFKHIPETWSQRIPVYIWDILAKEDFELTSRQPIQGWVSDDPGVMGLF